VRYRQKAKLPNRLVSTDVNLACNQEKGKLAFNTDGNQSGLSDDNGILTLLVGAPNPMAWRHHLRKDINTLKDIRNGRS
jgi:hypothetical protein